MNEKPDIVQVRVGKTVQAITAPSTKALQIKVGGNKSVIVYNHINGDILDALVKAVFPCDN